MGVTVHFVAANKPACLVLDIRELPKSHTGENMAALFEEILLEFGIEDKVSQS